MLKIKFLRKSVFHNVLAVVAAALLIVGAYFVVPSNIEYRAYSSSCADFNSNYSSCTATVGCSWPGNLGDCSDYNSNESSCSSTSGCTPNLTSCYWDDGGSCLGGGACSTILDSSSCNSSTYQSSCGGSYDNGVCTGSYDGTAPVFSTAIVSGATLTLTYNEALDTGSVPNTHPDFFVNVNDLAVAISSVNVTGRTVVLNLSSNVAAGSTVTINYGPGASPIQDIAGNDAASLSGQVVTNNTENTPSGGGNTGGQQTGGGSSGGDVNIIYNNRPVTNNPCLSGQKFNTMTGQICTSTGTTTSSITTLAKDLLFAGVPSGFRFNKNYSINSVNADILNLQVFLNLAGFPVTTTGYGSRGLENKRFGPATRAALAKFQKANNITPTVGYFGPITRGIINEMLKGLGL